MQIISHAVYYEFLPRTPLKVVRILLVEDCKSDVFLFESMLEDAPVNCFYEITDVPRLVDAFNKIEQDNFDLVMLDLNLLDIDGVASVAALRAQTPHIPIIVYSGTDDSKIKEKALMCGAMNYLVKGRESSHGLKRMIERAVG
jgi:CheY-like chemotaxis protein